MTIKPRPGREIDFPEAQANGWFRRELRDAHGPGLNVVQWREGHGTEIFWIEREGGMKQSPCITDAAAHDWYGRVSAELDAFLEDRQ